ncbi:sugar ABC transporter substrate-binding protein [Xaviernesmea oryzae]|uniref:Sugar ABC transporter substrate-binding protein n=1 Tax=Xaviernesmea oryzae TaxID=464029 RepID=A0A1Q9AWT8_9HYPH|nr:polysaccharide biosynthesis/export family protein [Xaviernesmea oryzae]OLP59922.1 sugar ABC transporter substrate-binding protein [Xaviernesmea oryzae]SEK45039.1 polysaccharide export outer membrane protein [Xaviernesmea oryzae]
MVLSSIERRAPARILAAALALVCLALSACTSYAPPPQAFHDAIIQPYRVDSGDRLRITVFEQAGLTGTYSVDQAGYITFPLVGAVPARGHTLPELEKTIAGKLRGGYLRDPDVTIEVDRYRSVFIMGEVGQAGQYSYVPGMTVQNAIAVAGGFTPRADQKQVDVTRKVNGKIVTGSVPITDPVLAGDTIYVRERLF